MKFFKKAIASVAAIVGFHAVASGDDALLERVRANIKEHGWHIVTVAGKDGDPGFCYTIGLRETSKHPELILFSPGSDPSKYAPQLNQLAKAIKGGARFRDGDIAPKAFGRFDGTLRKVLPIYHATYLGTAMAYYEKAPIEALQLFWPDAEGDVPWVSSFNPKFLAQPVLFQDNIIMAGMADGDLEFFVQQDGAAQAQASLLKLLVQPEFLNTKDMIAPLAGILPEGSSLHTVTIFGDVVLRQSDGSFVLVDTDAGEVFELADSSESLGWNLIRNMGSLIPQHVYLHAQKLGLTLKKDEVYSWRTPLSAGGDMHIDNLDKVSVAVHIKHRGESLSGTNNNFAEDDGILYEVVINESEQYSIWPAGKELASGWKKVGKKGKKPEVLAYIEQVWGDMRPKEVRDADKQ